jgi:mycothiol synthase
VAPAREQFVLRPPHFDDAAEVAAVLNELSRAVHGRDDTTADEIRIWFSLPSLDLERDARVAVRPDGRIAAYADVGDAANERRRFWIDLRVPPQADSDELSRALLDAMEARAREDAAPDAVVKVFLDAEQDDERARLEERGYQPVRHSFRMFAALDTEPEPAVWPEGIAVRTFEPGTDDERAYEAHQESFADQFEAVRDPYDEWRLWSFAAPFDPALWFLAEDGDELAGVCFCRPEREGDPELGWVSVLGVRRPWRRRGLGRALLLHAFAELRRHGKHRVGLGVDGLSPTGAVRLYERVGMRVERRFDHYQRPLFEKVG